MFVVNISYPLMKTVIEQVRQALVDNIDEKTRQNARVSLRKKFCTTV